ncbi:hypothetical protein E4U32_003345 [Claviceps aff. humidiphila group G2b]|nr:hypothetical protein E4U32_003345 [Claviceps aff. humidiphila group G2b]
MSRHPLSKCTLFDNCGAMHVVNDRSLLVPGTFKATTDDYLESGTSLISIVGRGKRVMKNIFNGKKGDHTVSLTLSDVAVVEGFHVNIVSASRVREQGVWYSNLDNTLRFGSYENSKIMATLVNKYD